MEERGKVFVAGDYPSDLEKNYRLRPDGLAALRMRWWRLEPAQRLGSPPIVGGMFRVERVDGAVQVLEGGPLSAREAVIAAQRLAGWDDVREGAR